MCVLSAIGNVKEKNNNHINLMIEAIAYHHDRGFATVTLDALIVNNSSEEIDYYFVHRGRVIPQIVDSTLLDYRPNEEYRGIPSQEDVLFYAFKDNIDANKPISNKYKERIPNWFSLKKEYTQVNNIFTPQVTVDKGICAENYMPPYTSLKVAKVPKGNSWFRIRFALDKVSYNSLVRHHNNFWVDCPKRVQDQINDEDLPIRGYLVPDSEKYFSDFEKSLIIPNSYEVIIFQPGTQGIDRGIECEPIAGKISEITRFNPYLEGKAIHYLTDPKDFWIDLSYKNEDTPPPPPKNIKTNPIEELVLA